MRRPAPTYAKISFSNFTSPRSSMPQPEILRQLGDHLVLRRSSPADVEALAEFNAVIHGDPAEGFRELYVAAWTRDLLTRPHPTFAPDDFTIVEDTQTGK